MARQTSMMVHDNRSIRQAYGVDRAPDDKTAAWHRLSSFKEAEHESVKLEQAGYKILKITPTTLPVPNNRG